jgi:hypothetical protein
LSREGEQRNVLEEEERITFPIPLVTLIIMSKKEAPATEQTHRIRITLTSLEVPKIESVSASIISNVKKEEFECYGPKRMPTKVMRITTRKTPCGEGIFSFLFLLFHFVITLWWLCFVQYYLIIRFC